MRIDMDIVLDGLREQKTKREQAEWERRLAKSSFEEVFRAFCQMKGLYSRNMEENCVTENFLIS